MTLGPFAPHSPLGYYDPWYYLSYFHDPVGSLNRWDGLYYTTRLPFILPGAVLYHFFEPVTANALLKTLVTWACVFPAFLLFLEVSRLSIALLLAVALSANIMLLSATLWDYPNGGSLAYLCFGIYFLFRCWRASDRSARSLLASGFCLSCAILTINTAVLIATATVASYFFSVGKERKAPRMLGEFALLLAGGALSLLAFGLASRALGGRFLFFMPQITYTLGVLRSGALEAVVMPVVRWIPLRPALAALLPALFLSLAIPLSPRTPWPRPLRFLASVFLLGVIPFLYLGLFRNRAVLQIHYQTAYLYGPAWFLVGGAIAHHLHEAWRHRNWRVFSIAAAAFLIVWPVYRARWFYESGFFHPWVTWVVALGVLALVVALSLTSVGTAKRSACFAIAALALLALPGATEFDFPVKKKESRAAYDAGIAVREALALAPIASNARLRANFYRKDPQAYLFDSLSSLFLWGAPADYFDQMRQASPPQRAGFTRPGDIHVFFSTEPHTAAYLRDLESVGVSGEPFNEARITRGRHDFRVTFIRVTRVAFEDPPRSQQQATNTARQNPSE